MASSSSSTLRPTPNLFVLIERFDLLEDESLQQPLVWTERFAEVLEAFGEWTRTRTKQEIYHAAQELRIAVTPVNTMADVAASEQLAARDWFGAVCVGDREAESPRASLQAGRHRPRPFRRRPRTR